MHFCAVGLVRISPTRCARTCASSDTCSCYHAVCFSGYLEHPSHHVKIVKCHCDAECEYCQGLHLGWLWRSIANRTARPPLEYQPPHEFGQNSV
jgi:hypothetical protein